MLARCGVLFTAHRDVLIAIQQVHDLSLWYNIVEGLEEGLL